ncbi:Lysylphosphatidylglycerol synthase TM region [Streptomyces wuyuanensis]|uniref:Lysylphosphatidylglycerol synthase TM region n=1 Tax=Streptomyces wuyuanensis TaxID=1196353 RepID=A0A1G9S2Q9_9ACTN|nr:Lysylphosphatidylglycerol synthase TM region [Streptomyces wuyuanensis]
MLAGAALVAATLWWQGTGAFVDGLRGIDAPTLLAALGIGLFTTVLSAWRWCLVARALDIRLAFGAAVAAYYRSLFLNAALPGGVAGDVHRAVRHGRSAGALGRGVRAVVLERVAGQAVLVAVGAVLLVAHPSGPLDRAGGAVRDFVTAPGAAAVLAVAAALVAVVAVRRRGGPDTSRWGRALRGTLAEARVAFLGRRHGPAVLVSSVAVLAGHLGMFLLAARAAGSAASAAELLPLMVLALLAMALPLNVGGWGPREGVTAWAFGAAGLGSAQGLSTAVAYGLLAFAAALPGAAVLAVQWFAGLRGAQVEFEEGVLAEEGAAHGRPERVPHHVGAGEGETGHAVADEHRRHGDVQPVEGALVQEAGHGHAAALHEHPAESPAREFVHQAAGGERGGVGEDQYVHSAAGRAVRLPVPTAGAHHPQGGGRTVGEHLPGRRDAAVRVEDDAHRVRAGAGADRQPGVVGDGGPGADDHRVGERAQPVQVFAVLGAGDVVGVALAGGDESVEALAELGEGEARSGQAQRQIALGEEVRLGGGVLRPPVPPVRVAEKSGGLGVRLGPYAQQALPGTARVERTGRPVEGKSAHRATSPAGAAERSGASNEKYAPKESTRVASNSLPFSADAREGRPTTPVSV